MKADFVDFFDESEVGVLSMSKKEGRPLLPYSSPTFAAGELHESTRFRFVNQQPV
jgi:hypothetical protein